jgi:hypothetical protein
MKHSKENFSTYRQSGKVIFATMMLIFVIVILAVFLGSSGQASAFSQLNKAEAKLTALGSLKTLVCKPKVGVMNGIVYNPPFSTAVVDKTTVHEGDKIHDVVVAAIHSDTVEFAKDGVTWQQNVLSKPNAAWTAQAKDTK